MKNAQQKQNEGKDVVQVIGCESGIEFSVEDSIYFLGEKAPMTVKAISDNFLIATRPLHRWYDANLIRHEVEMGAFFTFTEAYKAMRDYMIYTIVDLKNNIRGPHNLVFNMYDFKKVNDIKLLLTDLEQGVVEISYHNRSDYNLDFQRSLAS